MREEYRSHKFNRRQHEKDIRRKSMRENRKKLVLTSSGHFEDAPNESYNPPPNNYNKYGPPPNNSCYYNSYGHPPPNNNYYSPPPKKNRYGSPPNNNSYEHPKYNNGNNSYCPPPNNNSYGPPSYTTFNNPGEQHKMTQQGGASEDGYNTHHQDNEWYQRDANDEEMSAASVLIHQMRGGATNERVPVEEVYRFKWSRSQIFFLFCNYPLLHYLFIQCNTG